jgi:hypothetical protein
MTQEPLALASGSFSCSDGKHAAGDGNSSRRKASSVFVWAAKETIEQLRVLVFGFMFLRVMACLSV